ncbi:AraC-like DNA-binding protein [Breznakibacter xylanolyticus]|uniref:AraC-like DNA-binding protein n=2 Tax=Breznakibacter xylanolyticus TaxID=990 RepID=A0A2W7NJX4_9BACT|nr:AraC-like DNA-binding protein [Breznakibacter xylanolyticus]
MHEQVNLPGGSPIRVKWNHFPHFTFPWHFHSEYEILYVIKSYGKRFVADSVESFNEGDLVLLGSQVPHYWKNDDAFFNGDPALHVQAVVIQFSSDFMDQAMANYPELNHIKELLNRASQGIHFPAPENRSIGEHILSLKNKDGFERFMTLLQILNAMAHTPTSHTLGSPGFQKKMPNVKDQRLSKILNYINLNYTDSLTLPQLATQFGMNASAFSRYFKEKTAKSPIEYINEMRIYYACKLLQNTRQSISQIGYECGFNNISNFNRIFKTQLGMSPSEYQKQFLHP